MHFIFKENNLKQDKVSFFSFPDGYRLLPTGMGLGGERRKQWVWSIFHFIYDIMQVSENEEEILFYFIMDN